jgi:hypothetical protein
VIALGRFAHVLAAFIESKAVDPRLDRWTLLMRLSARGALTVRLPTLTSAIADIPVRTAANPVMPALAGVRTNFTDAEEGLI